jgi:hypothetical protein
MTFVITKLTAFVITVKNLKAAIIIIQLEPVPP